MIKLKMANDVDHGSHDHDYAYDEKLQIRDNNMFQKRVETVLGLKLDVEEDKEKGYPGVVCR